MAELRLEHIYKTYKGGVEAVKDLNLTVADGEFLALLGPSGCGKTSTLRMIVGLEEITRGEMYIRNRLVNSLEPNQRNVALAFETYALYPPLSVRENIAFNLRAKGVPPAEIAQRVQRVADMLDITDILDRKPAELGGGEKQRVSLARALVRDPDVFLMDEPLSHLDAAQRAHMRVELKRLHAETGRTTILVTHDQLEAVAMAERIAVMNFGVLQQVGTFEQIYNHPANEFVAGFIGEPPMNFLPAQSVSSDGKLGLQAADGSFRIELPPVLAARVQAAKSGKVDIGIRPIHMTLAHHGEPTGVASGAASGAASAAGNGQVVLDGSVLTYEDLGEEGQLAVKVGGSQVLAVTPPALQLRRGEKATLAMRADRVHLFDGDTQNAL